MANGTAVGTVAATDGDVTPTTFQNWAITGGTAATAFAINAATGQITVADATQLDRETVASFTLLVTVSDGVNTSAAADGHDQPDRRQRRAARRHGRADVQIAENTANGTAVGTVPPPTAT